MSFTWPSLIQSVAETETEHVVTAAVVSVGLIMTSLYARKAIGNGDEAYLPAAKPSIKGIFELLIDFISGLTEMVIGEGGNKYIPYFCSVFLFVLANNLFGILPGVVPSTENINMTFAMGIFSFLAYNYYGIKENGIGYLKHFLGPVLLLAPIMLPIELISHLVRPFSLGLRLANVMMGDHTVVGIFLDLVPIALPIPFYLLGIFVCFVQAFVFTLLSMVYIAMATAHDH